jgi:outer membrane protein
VSGGFRKVCVASCCSAGVLLGLAASAARAETLADAIGLAYQTNPRLQSQRATQRATDETYVQARSGLQPTVSLSAAAIHDDLPSPLIPQINASGVALSVTQPLYSGGRVTSLMSAASAGAAAGREGLRGLEQNVLLDVIEAYVDVRRDLQSVAIAQENERVLQRQLAEAEANFQVKTVTRTDVAQSTARLAGAQARLALAQTQLETSRAHYLTAVGREAGDLAPEPPIGGLLPSTRDQARELAERNNPIIRQLDYAEQGAAAQTDAARADARPKVSLYASVGYAGGSFHGGSPFADYGRSTFVGAVATVPLFSGGRTSSEVRQATERDNAARINIEVARRQVAQAVSEAWSGLSGARARLVADEQQAQAAAVARDGVRHEADVGVRTTLDVLNAEQELRDAELAVVSARRDQYVAGAALLAAMGALTPAQFSVDAPLYDPKVNFEKVRKAGSGVPWEPAVEALDRLGSGTAR